MPSADHFLKEVDSAQIAEWQAYFKVKEKYREKR
jgi:hypothetical protein